MSLRSLQLLDFVPPPHVYAYFCTLMSTLEPTNELQELIMYFVTTWMAQGVFMKMNLNYMMIREMGVGYKIVRR